MGDVARRGGDMRILLSGYGKLGKALGTQLSGTHEVVILKRTPVHTDFRQINADIAVYHDVYDAMDGIDAVIHTAAKQDPRMDPAHYNDFFDINIKGTHNILQAALTRNIKRVVISSSIVVCGNLVRIMMGMVPEKAMRIDENVALKPQTVYDFNKVVNEQTAEFYARVHGMNVICLRYGGFFPKHEGPDYVKMLLSWFVHTEDVAQAARLAVESEIEGYGVYVVVPKIRFTEADSEELVRDPDTVVKRHYPQEYEFVKAKELSFSPIPMWWDSGKAQRELGFAPTHNFEDEVRRCL